MKLFIYLIAILAAINFCLATILAQPKTPAASGKAVKKKAPKNNGELTKEDKKKADKYYKKYAGPDGKLSKREFNQVFYALGVKGLSPGAFELADLNGDGVVEKPEFLQYYSVLKRNSAPN